MTYHDVAQCWSINALTMALRSNYIQILHAFVAKGVFAWPCRKLRELVSCSESAEKSKNKILQGAFKRSLFDSFVDEERSINAKRTLQNSTLKTQKCL